MRNTITSVVDMASQQQQNNGSSRNGAACEDPPSKESSIAKFCNWFSKKSNSTDAQQSTEQSQQPEIPDETNRSRNGAGGEKPPEDSIPIHIRLQKKRKNSPSKESFIAKFCNLFSKKSTSTDAQQSTEESQPQEIPDETPERASVDTSEVHGYEHEELWLVRCLIKPDEGDFKAIGIVGMPDVGKTALARLVFDNEYVKHHFFPKIWVSVSEIKTKPETETKKQKVVETILRELGVDDQMIANFAERGVAALLYALHLKLAGKRYLIVLDGVCKGDDCCHNLISPVSDDDEKENEEFSFAFPKGSGGAVIVTSRRKETAEKMVGVGEGERKGEKKEKILHTPRPIEDLDSCFSIYNSVLDSKVPEKSITEDLKKEFRMKSGGLPMAARLMAKIKNKKDQQNNRCTNRQDHQNVGSGAENREIVQAQEPKKDEGTHGDSHQIEDKDGQTVTPPIVQAQEQKKDEDANGDSRQMEDKDRQTVTPPIVQAQEQKKDEGSQGDSHQMEDKDRQTVTPPIVQAQEQKKDEDAHGDSRQMEDKDRQTVTPPIVQAQEQKKDEGTQGDSHQIEDKDRQTVTPPIVQAQEQKKDEDAHGDSHQMEDKDHQTVNPPIVQAQEQKKDDDTHGDPHQMEDKDRQMVNTPPIDS